jgi:hypothetical protein
MPEHLTWTLVSALALLDNGGCSCIMPPCPLREHWKYAASGRCSDRCRTCAQCTAALIVPLEPLLAQLAAVPHSHPPSILQTACM